MLRSENPRPYSPELLAPSQDSGGGIADAHIHPSDTSFAHRNSFEGLFDEFKKSISKARSLPESKKLTSLFSLTEELWRIIDRSKELALTSTNLGEDETRAALYETAVHIFSSSSTAHKQQHLWNAFFAPEIVRKVGIQPACEALRLGLLRATVPNLTVQNLISTIYAIAPHAKDQLIDTFRSVDKVRNSVTEPIVTKLLETQQGGAQKSFLDSSGISRDWSIRSFQWAANNERACPSHIAQGVVLRLRQERELLESQPTKTSDSLKLISGSRYDARYEILESLSNQIITALTMATEVSVYEHILGSSSQYFDNLHKILVGAFTHAVSETRSWTKQDLAVFHFLIEKIAQNYSLSDSSTLVSSLLSLPGLPATDARRAMLLSACWLDSTKNVAEVIAQFRTHFPRAKIPSVYSIASEVDPVVNASIRAEQILKIDWKYSAGNHFQYKIIKPLVAALTTPAVGKFIDFLFYELDSAPEEKRVALVNILFSFCDTKYSSRQPSPQTERLFGRLVTHPSVSDSAIRQLGYMNDSFKRILVIARPWLTEFGLTSSKLREGTYLFLRAHASKKNPEEQSIRLPGGPIPELRIAGILGPFIKDATSLPVITRLKDSGQLQRHIHELLLFDQSNNYSIDTLTELTQNLIEYRESLPSRDPRTWYQCFPVSRVDRVKTKIDASIAKSNMAIIGGGPAGLTMAALRAQLGYFPEATTLFEPRKELGGIWTQANVIKEGHNSFRGMSVLGATLRASENRPGEELLDYLKALEKMVPHSSISDHSVQSVEYDCSSKRYVVTSRKGGGVCTALFDSVLIATGNAQAKPLSDLTIPNNFHTFPKASFIRWQNQIPLEHYSRFEDTAPVVIGLGNSALTMMGEFLKMKEAGVNVRPHFLTDLPKVVIDHPGDAWEDSQGIIYHPLYRHPGNLSGVAGDVNHLAQRFLQARNLGWIVSDVEDMRLVTYSPHSSQMNVTYGGGQFLRINDIPAFFLLIGYKNNVQLLKRFGCTLNESNGEVEYNPLTGQVVEALDRDGPSRLFIAGAAASRSGDRNQEVIPGMTRTIMHIAVTEMLQAYVRQLDSTE